MLSLLSGLPHTTITFMTGALTILDQTEELKDQWQGQGLTLKSKTFIVIRLFQPFQQLKLISHLILYQTQGYSIH